ncbi:hypothetical protein CC2G_002979 [Coprinopsis cinerea AmutBmut pab1-1]|nr:hypothetical protein CC2G_002979 [Coprinopsis cinerea AmutBmut pab1-1]
MAISAVQRSLQIPELQHKVFDLLAEDGKFETLANAAVSCRFLHDGAVRSLWKEIPNLWVISSFFPNGCFKNVDNWTVWDNNAFSTAGKFSVVKSPKDISSGIARLARYTPLVKAIHFDPDARRWDYTALHVMSDKGLLPFPLFPNVERVVLPLLFKRRFETMFYPSFVISPSVRSITVLTNEVFNIHGDDFAPNDPFAQEDSQHSKALVNRLVVMAPYSTELIVKSTVPDWYEFHTPTSALNSMFARLPATSTIRVLDVTHLAAKGSHLKELAKLPDLVDLKISLRGSTLDDVEVLTPWDFRALVSVEITSTSHTIDPCTRLFTSIRAPHLSDIKIHQNLCQNTDLDDLFLALSQCTPPEQVSSIFIDQVSYNDNANGFSPHKYGFFTAFTPLAQFKNIKQLELSPFTVTPGLRDRALIAAFGCWPKLERLHFRSDSIAALTMPSLTLHGVYTAIRCCPRLSHITLPVAATKVPALPVTPHPSLVSWNICNSPITSGLAVGNWMKAAFPHLHEIQHFGFLRGCLRSFGMQTRYGGDMGRDILESMPEEVSMIVQWNDVARIVRSP